MANTNSTEPQRCFEFSIENYQYFIISCALPFQILMFKVLAKDLGFGMPRHIIAFSLLLSDAMQPIMFCICTIVTKAGNITEGNALCDAIVDAFLFVITVAVVVTSLGVLFMSVERYIACIHSLYLHHILSHRRVTFISIFQWVIGTILGVTEVLTNKPTNTIITKASLLHISIIILTCVTLIPVCSIQLRLFLFARRKMKMIIPAGAFGVQLELAHYRKKQIKATISTGIVAIGVVVCFLPLASIFLYELVNDTTASPSDRSICVSLAITTSLANPFIYGIGTADTRKMLVRNLKRIKQFLFST